MTRKRSPHDWTDLDFGTLAAGEPSRLIAVLPLAATEQHGPHLPLGTDIMIGEAYLARVREILPQASPARFLPMQPVGISTEHIDFPGTLTLPTETALQSWLAIGDSVARAGIRKLVMVTSHGGNSAAMSLVAQDLRARHGMLAVTTSWSRFGVPDGLFTAEEIRHGVHGGAIETSIMLAAWPDQVRTDKNRELRTIEHRDGARLQMAQRAPPGAVRMGCAGSASERRSRRRDAGHRGEGTRAAGSRGARASANCSWTLKGSS